MDGKNERTRVGKESRGRTLGVRNSKGKGERESLKERKGERGRSGSTTS